MLIAAMGFLESHGSIRSAISAASSAPPWWAGRKTIPAALPGSLYALAGFALMSAVISAVWLRIFNPLRHEMAGVPAE
jgi:hypothetical protein